MTSSTWQGWLPRRLGTVAGRFSQPPHLRQFCYSMGMEQTYIRARVTRQTASPSEYAIKECNNKPHTFSCLSKWWIFLCRLNKNYIMDIHKFSLQYSWAAGTETNSNTARTVTCSSLLAPLASIFKVGNFASTVRKMLCSPANTCKKWCLELR